MEKIERLVQNFLRYVAIPSQSKGGVAAVPSTEGQKVLAKTLEKELIDLGLEDVCVDEHSIVYGTLKGNTKAPTIGFVSHLDTVDVSLSEVVKPQIIEYRGGDVVLNKDKNIVIKVSEHPELNKYVGDKVIFTDGTSVLGADNKSAMANIMSALQILVEDPTIPHGDLKVAFVPDEEVGLKGSKLMNLDKFKVDFAYTIDSCALGEVVYETFNAGSATVTIQGVTAHPMSAKDVLVNPLLVAHDFIEMFDRMQTPEHTALKDGYWWFDGVTADPLNCTLDINIRDHDKANYNHRKEVVFENIEKLKKLHPRAQINCTITDVYENIANNVSATDKPIAMIYEAFKDLGIEPHTYAMRGGTDGSALSAKGIVTPNYFTGAENFHSYCEFLPLKSFEKSLNVTLKLIELATK